MGASVSGAGQTASPGTRSVLYEGYQYDASWCAHPFTSVGVSTRPSYSVRMNVAMAAESPSAAGSIRP